MPSQLDVFFSPQSVAVIGASRTPGKIGHTILENLKQSFQGKIYPVNPNTNEILGLACFPSVLEIAEPIDLAVIVVPTAIVEQTLAECVKKKIKGAIIISAGFAEVGDKKSEDVIKKFAEKILIIGPNCLGTVSSGRFNNLFLQKERFKLPPDGLISFVCQSGAVGSALLDSLAMGGIGISKFVSYGNAAGLDEIDFLEYFGKDVGTRAIAVYVESIKDGKRFVDVAKRITPTKPIVVLKAGGTSKGNEAVISHTGALAGPAEVFSAAFRQAGVVEVKSLEELFDFAKVLASQPVLKSNKIAIITNGGGFGVLATDSAAAAGFELPTFSKEPERKLREFLPAHVNVKNPLDLTGDTNSERFRKAIEIVMKDKEVGGAIFITLLQTSSLDDSVIPALQDAKLFGKPFVVCALGSEYTFKTGRKLEAIGIPVYPTPERAVKALSALWNYKKEKALIKAEVAAEKKVEKKPATKAKKKKR
ncbi:MAG TPA: CoA-binding protein [archaeon]|nr:CoA-binding protein [archaeon]